MIKCCGDDVVGCPMVDDGEITAVYKLEDAEATILDTTVVAVMLLKCEGEDECISEVKTAEVLTLDTEENGKLERRLE